MTKMSAQYVIRDFDDEICREHINDHCFGIGAWNVTLDMLNDQSYWTEVCRSFHTILYRERVQFQHDKVVNYVPWYAQTSEKSAILGIVTVSNMSTPGFHQIELKLHSPSGSIDNLLRQHVDMMRNALTLVVWTHFRESRQIEDHTDVKSLANQHFTSKVTATKPHSDAVIEGAREILVSVIRRRA